MEFIEYCKKTRQFASVIRDGIRLIWSLREGNLDVLFELFPHLQRQFKPDADDLVEQFRQILLQQQSVSVDSRVGQSTPKQLPPTAAPVAVITAAASVSIDEIHDNFMAFLQ